MRGLEIGSMKLSTYRAFPGVGVLPHVFVGDEASPLKRYIVRPYYVLGASDEQGIFQLQIIIVVT